MRVNLIGNTCNCNFVLAQFLRAKGIDAQLYYRETGDAQEQPWTEDPSLRTEHVDWIHSYTLPRRWYQPAYALPGALLQELARADILHVQGATGVIWAAQTGRPFLWQPFGSDFAIHPFWHRYWMVTRRWGIPVSDVRNWATPIRLRQAMQKAAAIVIGWHDETWMDGYQLAKNLGLFPRIHREHFALSMDRFSPGPADTALRQRFCPNGELMIFHPARQAFSESAAYLKGNDRLYRALARLKQRGGKFHLVIVDKNDPDTPAARALIAECGIAGQVTWVPPMPRAELVRWYRSADITADAFVDGGLGTIALEAMSCGCPVLLYLKRTSTGAIFFDPEKLYGELPPVLSAATEEEIAAVLLPFIESPERLAATRAAGISWTRRFVAGEAVADRFIALYRQILKT